MSATTLLARLGPLHLLPKRTRLALQLVVAFISATLGVFLGPDSPLALSQTHRYAMSQRLGAARQQVAGLPELQAQALRLGLDPEAQHTELTPMVAVEEIQSALLAWFETVALACGVELQRFGLQGTEFDEDSDRNSHHVMLSGPNRIDKRRHSAWQRKSTAVGDKALYPSYAISLQAKGAFETILALVEEVAAADPPFIPLRGHVQVEGELLHLELELRFEGARAPNHGSLDPSLASTAPLKNPFHQALGPSGKSERVPRLLGTLVSNRRRQAMFELAGRHIIVGPGHVFDTRIVNRIEPSAVTVVSRDDGSSGVISVIKKK